MTVPASPFVGRLLAEIASVGGGLPTAAAEMGIKPQVINAIANGGWVSTDDLSAVYTWLADHVTLLPEENEDYHQRQAAARKGPARISPSALPPSGPDPQTGSAGVGRGDRRGGWTTKEITLATVVAVLIVALTVVITIVIVHPANSGSSEATVTPTTRTPSATDSPAAPVPVTSGYAPASTATSSPSPPLTTGKLIGRYDNFKLSEGYSITFASGGRPQPDSSGPDDLQYYDASGSTFASSGGAVALLSEASPSYANCKADTALGSFVSSVAKGDTICFQGHGVVAGAYVVNYASSGGINYVTLDVRVWRDATQS